MVGRRGVWARLALLLLWVLRSGSPAGAFVGVNYGTRGDNLPTPADAVALLKGLGIGYCRIFNSDAAVIQAFGGSNILLWIAVQDQEILGIAVSNSTAQAWVKNNVLAYVPAVNISGITVGNEVLTQLQSPQVAPYLVPAMTNLHTALQAAKLDGVVKVSTPHSVSVLGTSFPPYDARFNQSLLPNFVLPLLSFLDSTGSYLMINLYPSNDYQHSSVISLDYALFRPNVGITDPNTGLHYDNEFDAVLDAFYYALAAANVSDLPVVVAATGWPSVGDSTETGITVDNAQTYNQNLLLRLLNNTGTPTKPGLDIGVMIYELFNEDAVPGPTSARNWGLYYPNQTAVYPLDWAGTGVLPNASATSWCIAKSGVSGTALQFGLDYACGIAASVCKQIQPSGNCFLPNTVASHASWAYNSYYQMFDNAPGTCDFGGTAVITYQDPSYGGCKYPGRSANSRSNAVGGGPGSDLAWTILCCCLAMSAVLSSLLHF